MRLCCVFLIVSSSRAVALEASLNDLKKMSIEDLLQVEVVSVSRAPEKLSNTASSVQVITQEDIRRSGVTSLPEALRLASNLQVAQKNAHDWGVSARGFNTELANKLLVMIDGRTVYTPLFSGVFWNAQDYLLADIDHIEVISGPGGTLWGANAVNGVINIITRHSRDTRDVYAEAGGGSGMRSFAGARVGGALNSNASFRVYAKYSDHDNSVLGNGNDANDAWRMKQGGFRVDVTHPFDRLTFQGDIYENSSDADPGKASIKGSNVLTRWSHAFSEGSELNLQAYYDRTHLDRPLPAYVINNLTLAPAGVFADVMDTYDVDLQHRFRFMRRHQLVWGLGYRHTHDSATNIPALAFYPALLTHHLYSGFIQDAVSLSDRVTITAGTKLEHNTYTGWEWEPSVRAQWEVNTRNMLWSAISRAVRSPSRIDRDYSQPAAGLVVIKGSDTFVSEKVLAYEAGYRTQMNDRLVASTAIFYNNYQHLRSTSITPTTILPLYFENNLKGYTYGIELNGTFQIAEWWQMRAGYTFLSEHLSVEPGKFDLSQAHNETADPQHQVMLRSMLELPGRVQLDAELRWVDELIVNNGPNVATVPDYTELDIRIGWRITESLELSLTGQNLLHNHHPEFGFPTPTRVDAERNVTGKLVWRL